MDVSKTNIKGSMYGNNIVNISTIYQKNQPRVGVYIHTMHGSSGKRGPSLSSVLEIKVGFHE